MTPTEVARLARLETPFPAPSLRPALPAPVLDGFVLMEGVLLPACARLARATWSTLWSMSTLDIGRLTAARVHCYQRDYAAADDLDPLDGVLQPIRPGEPPVYRVDVIGPRYRLVERVVVSHEGRARRLAVELAARHACWMCP
jgi:hypothetical protein